jgi:hypothetical protein
MFKKSLKIKLSKISRLKPLNKKAQKAIKELSRI